MHTDHILCTFSQVAIAISFLFLSSLQYSYTYLTTMKVSLKFTITLAAIAIAALLLPTASAALKGTEPRVNDDIDHHRALEKGLFGPGDNPQKPPDTPGKIKLIIQYLF